MTGKNLVERVVIPSEGRFKFVLIDLENGSGLVLRGYKLQLHMDIVNESYRIEGIRGYIPGGGRIEVCPSMGLIHAYGYSGDFGEASQREVETLLKPYAENLGYELFVEMGVGY